LQQVTNNGIAYYQFENLKRLDVVFHGIFTRQTGLSKSPFDSLNIARDIGDDHHSVKKNREIVAGCFDNRKLVYATQVHGDRVLVIDRLNPDSLNPGSPPPLTGDALVTDIPRIGLVIQVADCQAVMLVDPVRQVVANVHAGWRGSIKNIIGRTISTMEARFSCRPRDMIAGIGPALGPCCAEFLNYRSEIPDKFWTYKDHSHHFDFWAVSRDQLIAAGVRAEKIDLSRICTKCHTDLFFSYRGEGKTGRFAAVIGLDS
jgi:YfiH family protein